MRRGTVLLPSPEAPPTGRPALLTAAGEALSYDQLRAAVDDLASRLPDAAEGRCLVHLSLRQDPASVLAYLATLEAGHVALVTPEGDRSGAILHRYRPDVTATGDPARPFQALSDFPRHLLHPDLALLLSTSGSTGSPKLVRLSYDNLASNATAIAAALRLTEADRAITSLPLHYTFGLSVLHSHLVAGASVVLHDGSVLEDAFWRAVDELGVTTLAAVPHTVELMESTGVLMRPHPSLRLLAQAGGRMSPDRVARTAALGRRRGWELAVMYGQTEATARICVLDPALVADNPDAVGRPVAGTILHIDTTVSEATDGTGEVVVRGPGVMMGYAEHPDDLALGAMLDELRTGDLGRVGPDGLLRLVGRRSGFVKVMGVRIDLSAVENDLEAAGFLACVGGDEVGLTVLVEPGQGSRAAATAAQVRRLVGRSSGLGPAAVAVAVADLPRLPNGKVDRRASAARVRSTPAGDGPDPSLAVEVAAAVGQVLGVDAVDIDRTFVQHGGDSLSHVQASVRLERLLGQLPSGWHHRPLRELAERGEDRAPTGARPRWRTVETSVLLRAIAVVIICSSHAGLFALAGGAHILLAVVGFNAARFGLSMPTSSGRWRATGRMLVAIAVPTLAVATVGMVTTGRYGWSNLTFVHWLVGDTGLVTRNEFWFVDALVGSLLLLTAALSVPAVGQAWRRDPWRVAVVVTGLALIPRFVIIGSSDAPLQLTMPTTFWLVALGAAGAYADTRRRRLLTVGLGVVGAATFFPDDPLRTAVVLAGIFALVLVPQLRVPALLVPAISVLAAASLYVYLVQFQVLSLLEDTLAETLAALTVGILLWRLVDRPVRRLQDLLPPPTR